MTSSKEFADRDDFDDIIEYEAYVLTCLVCNVFPSCPPQETCEVIVAALEEHGGFDARIAADLGAALRALGLASRTKTEYTH